MTLFGRREDPVLAWMVAAIFMIPVKVHPSLRRRHGQQRLVERMADFGVAAHASFWRRGCYSATFLTPRMSPVALRRRIELRHTGFHRSSSADTRQPDNPTAPPQAG